MKKRALHGLGIALMLASPLWITMQEPPSYLNFGVSLVLGILLLILASKTNPGRLTPSTKALSSEPFQFLCSPMSSRADVTRAREGSRAFL